MKLWLTTSTEDIQFATHVPKKAYSLAHQSCCAMVTSARFLAWCVLDSPVLVLSLQRWGTIGNLEAPRNGRP